MLQQGVVQEEQMFLSLPNLSACNFLTIGRYQ